MPTHGCAPTSTAKRDTTRHLDSRPQATAGESEARDPGSGQMAHDTTFPSLGMWTRTLQTQLEPVLGWARTVHTDWQPID